MGVQLDITASPPPKAGADARRLQVAGAHHVASREPEKAAPPTTSPEHGSHQRDVVMLPAATQQVQSQVGATYILYRHSNIACCTCLLSADLRIVGQANWYLRLDSCLCEIPVYTFRLGEAANILQVSPQLSGTPDH